MKEKPNQNGRSEEYQDTSNVPTPSSWMIVAEGLKIGHFEDKVEEVDRLKFDQSGWHFTVESGQTWHYALNETFVLT